jgi:hypothetical protein
MHQRTISPWQVRRYGTLPDWCCAYSADTRRVVAPGRQPRPFPVPPDVGRGFFCYCGRNPSDTSFIPRLVVCHRVAASSAGAGLPTVEDEAAHREQWSGLRRCSRKSFPAKVLIGAIDNATG